MSQVTELLPATLLISCHLAACLPPGTPSCYRSFISAHYVGTGRNRVATADLEMFDGLIATIEVFECRFEVFGHRWTAMAGGDAFFEDGRWQRKGEAG